MATANYTINPFKCIELLPNFSGQVGTLNNFIAQVDIYYQLVPGTDVLGRNVMNGLIRNKITEEASNSLISIGNPLEWETIRKHLLDYFSDKRSIDHLKRKLTELVQRNKTLEEYYSEASDIQTALINAVDPSLPPTEKQYYIRDIAREVLREFLLGLKPELSNYTRPQNPANIKEAFELARNQENYIRGQQAKLNLRPQHQTEQPKSSRPISSQNSQPWQPMFPNSRPRFWPNQNFSAPFSQNRQSFNPHRFNPQTSQNPFTNPRQPNFRPPQFAQYKPMPFRQNQFQFPQQSRQPLPKPTPMDISVQTRQNPPTQQRPFFSNNNQAPNFVSRELHAQEPIQDLEPYDSQDYTEYYNQFYGESQPFDNQEYGFSHYSGLSENPEEALQAIEPEIDDQNFQLSSQPLTKT